MGTTVPQWLAKLPPGKVVRTRNIDGDPVLAAVGRGQWSDWTIEVAFPAALVDEQLITLDEALERVTGEQLARLMFPQFDRSGERTLLARGLAASPGAAVGAAVPANAPVGQKRDHDRRS